MVLTVLHSGKGTAVEKSERSVVARDQSGGGVTRQSTEDG